MTTNHDIDDAIARVLEATTPNFVELTTIAGLDPAKDFRHANLSEVDFTGSNLAGFDFRGASFDGATFINAKIAGAKFSRSPQLDNLLRCAVDADEVLIQDRLQDRFPLHRRRRRHRGKWSAGEAPTTVAAQNHISIAKRNQSENFSHLPRFLLNPVTVRKNNATIDQPNFLNPKLNDSLLWLEQNPEAIDGALVIKRLVRLSCGRDEIVRRGLRWLNANSETTDASIVLVVLLKLAGQEELIQQLALRWLDMHPTLPQGADLLCVLLRTLPSKAVAARALNWIDANPHKSGVGRVLFSLIETVGYDQLIERALRWINGHASVGAAANLLTNFLNANPTDETMRGHCLSWMDKNPTARPAVGVLIALLRCSKFDNQIRQLALHWLAANWEWPHTVAVVDQMARSCHSGDDAWEYVRKWAEANSGRGNLPRALRGLARQSGDRIPG